MRRSANGGCLRRVHPHLESATARRIRAAPVIRQSTTERLFAYTPGACCRCATNRQGLPPERRLNLWVRPTLTRMARQLVENLPHPVSRRLVVGANLRRVRHGLVGTGRLGLCGAMLLLASPLACDVVVGLQLGDKRPVFFGFVDSPDRLQAPPDDVRRARVSR